MSTPPPTLDKNLVSTAIERYARQAGAMKAWIAGLSAQDVDAFPVPKTWSVRQLVVHMVDSDLAATHRMRRIVAEETPLLIAYDETKFCNTPVLMGVDLAQSAALFELNRLWNASWLRALPVEAFARPGVHNQRGKVSLYDFVRIYGDHVEHHETFLKAKRTALAKPLAL